MHRHLLHNGKIRNTDEPLISPGQTGYMTGWGVFSTLRVADGVLFAFDRHYQRMRHDAQLLRVPFLHSADALRAELEKLIEANGACNATLRVSVIRNRGGAFQGPDENPETDLVAFTTDLRNWGSDVKLSYVPHGRHGASPFAGTKVNSWAQNLAWYEDAHARGFDEVILLNEEGMVSECTSANVFIITGKNEVLTPPLQTSGCLPGVTRALLLEEVRLPGYVIREAEISPSELEAAKQVFITSSTRDLLPAASVDGLELEQSPTQFEPLRQAFAELIASYVRDRSRNLAV